MKNFCFNTICNITQEPQELQRYNRVCRFIGKSTVIKCHQVLSKVTSINRRSLFDQLATLLKGVFNSCILNLLQLYCAMKMPKRDLNRRRLLSLLVAYNSFLVRFIESFEHPLRILTAKINTMFLFAFPFR